MSDKPLKDRLKNISHTVLSDEWAQLARYEFDYQRRDGGWDHQTREVYDRGNAVAVLPYDPARGTVLLLKQFRLPAFLNGDTAPLIEVCAGVLDEDDPEACARREAREELGYQLRNVEYVCKAYSSPGSVLERIWCFTARYSPEDRVSEGGGVADEGEDIEILELTLEEACGMIASGDIMDAKTILLLQHLKLSLTD